MILVTGGTGYIGSHTCVSLINSGYKVIIIDNFCNSEEQMAGSISHICGKSPLLLEGDIRDPEFLDKVFSQYEISCVLHFAGLKAVGESVKSPIDYYDNNVQGSVQLFKCMAKAGVKSIVFSSSATVYGDPASLPIRESFNCSPSNPYGRTKMMVEDILSDIYVSDRDWKIVCLRYFNPVGAHPSGLIGEAPKGIPNNLMPYVAQVATGEREKLFVYGGDYNTPDGTGVRDYIHVVDLAEGHVAALSYLEKNGTMVTVNLGTGRGYSVLEIKNAFEKASGRHIPFEIVGRRVGDIAQCWADPSAARQFFGWQARKNLDDMCNDTWRWQQSKDGK